MANSPVTESSFTLQPGFRFNPTEYDLLYILKYKVEAAGCPLPEPYPALIPDANVYGDHPSTLFMTPNPELVARMKSLDDDDEQYAKILAKEEDDVRYFFTPLKKVKGNGKRIVRRAGEFGTWKGQKTHCILNETEKIEQNHCNLQDYLGTDGYFKYVPDKDKSQDTSIEWQMHEFTLREYPAGTHPLALCRITKKEPKNKDSVAAAALCVHQVQSYSKTTVVQPTVAVLQQQRQQELADYAESALKKRKIEPEATDEPLLNIVDNYDDLLEFDFVKATQQIDDFELEFGYAEVVQADLQQL